MAVLVNPAAAASTDSTLKDLEVAARTLGLQIQVLNVSTSGEIDAAFGTFVHERPDAIFVSSDPFFTSRRVQVANLAAHNASLITIDNKISIGCDPPPLKWSDLNYVF